MNRIRCSSTSGPIRSDRKPETARLTSADLQFLKKYNLENFIKEADKKWLNL